jgi:hypothetical protein
LYATQKVKPFAQIELEIKELAEKARTKKISVEELTGGTFTITNGGVFGSLLSTPIINPPQSAILGMHNIVDRPVAVNGQVVIQANDVHCAFLRSSRYRRKRFSWIPCKSERINRKSGANINRRPGFRKIVAGNLKTISSISNSSHIP